MALHLTKDSAFRMRFDAVMQIGSTARILHCSPADFVEQQQQSGPARVCAPGRLVW